MGTVTRPKEMEPFHTLCGMFPPRRHFGAPRAPAETAPVYFRSGTFRRYTCGGAFTYRNSGMALQPDEDAHGDFDPCRIRHIWSEASSPRLEPCAPLLGILIHTTGSLHFSADGLVAKYPCPRSAPPVQLLVRFAAQIRRPERKTLDA